MLLGILKLNKIVLLLMVLFLFSFLYISKPDYGGISRCERIFQIEQLSNHISNHKPFFTWDLFEDPKFRFSISSNSYASLYKYLAKYGYLKWEEGSVQHGSLIIGGAEGDNVFYSIKYVGKNSYIMAIDKKNNYLYALACP